MSLDPSLAPRKTGVGMAASAALVSRTVFVDPSNLAAALLPRVMKIIGRTPESATSGGKPRQP